MILNGIMNLCIIVLSSDSDKPFARSDKLSEHDSNSSFSCNLTLLIVLKLISNRNVFDLPCCLLQDSLLGVFFGKKSISELLLSVSLNLLQIASCGTQLECTKNPLDLYKAQKYLQFEIFTIVPKSDHHETLKCHGVEPI